MVTNELIADVTEDDEFLPNTMTEAVLTSITISSDDLKLLKLFHYPDSSFATLP
ncbi:hypothetical protein PAXRUDRAFT_17837 [Paxillus rubicundulus Ve08.2h10]|uniref:Uncharacterized protein n=1 Tax=Paxillus rubicundulus Ve08.2h10 TaxID=930991 RepID=A0A0D0DGD7_9AGAM|nr:hypothetical protein PAXRUDRAFT_17837 [Paxillus rubicundulus Ve08.2h10]